MSLHTQSSNNGTTKKPQSLSQIERQAALERSKRICIVCGQLVPILASVAYPKGRARRKEFDKALNLPVHVSRALPFGCYICGEHFHSSELDFLAGGLQIADSVIPTLNLDYEFLRTLRSLKEDELGVKNVVKVAKAKLGWDTKPPQLINQTNGYKSDESQNSSDPDILVSNLFKNPVVKRRSIRLMPVSSTTSADMAQLPPILERMENSIDCLSDLPPTLSPVTPKSEPSTSTSKTNETDKKDLLIQHLRQSLLEKTTELSLLKKKLEITEELLQFYQQNYWKNELQAEENQILDPSPHATAMLIEANQFNLQQFLNGD